MHLFREQKSNNSFLSTEAFYIVIPGARFVAKNRVCSFNISGFENHNSAIHILIKILKIQVDLLWMWKRVFEKGTTATKRQCIEHVYKFAAPIFLWQAAMLNIRRGLVWTFLQGFVLFEATSSDAEHSCRLNYTFLSHKSKMEQILLNQAKATLLFPGHKKWFETKRQVYLFFFCRVEKPIKWVLHNTLSSL